MKKYIFTNSFHRTNAVVLLPEEMIRESQGETWSVLMCAEHRRANDGDRRNAWRRKIERVSSVLCGCPGCTCGVIR